MHGPKYETRTLQALDRRGMLSPEMVGLVEDQGLFMQLRIRNARAASNTPIGRSWAMLQQPKPSRALGCTFYGQLKRDRNDKSLAMTAEQREEQQRRKDVARAWSASAYRTKAAAFA